MKHKIEEIIESIRAEKRTVTPLKISYDNHSDTVTRIVIAIFACRRLMSLQKRIEDMDDLDINEVQSVAIRLSQYKSDVDWLFFTSDKKQELIQDYLYLVNVLKGENIKYFNWSLRYGFNNLNLFDAETAWKDFRDYSVDYYNCIESLVPNAFEDPNFAYGLPEELARQIEQEVIYPDGLTCTLRRYQTWGVKYILHQVRTLLGDEMGLGKTIQAIAAMVSLKNVNYHHFLVICPASVVVNWFKEIHKHSKLQAYIGHGSTNTRRENTNAWKYHGGVLITTYETYPNLGINNYSEIGMVVVDEAHYVKNPDAVRSINVRHLCGQVERVLFLTGTPIENNVEEMLSLLSVLNNDVANHARSYAYITASQQFKEAVAPVYFRRKQSDVNKELPEKIENIAWCEMGSEERTMYEDVTLERKNLMAMRRVSWMMADMDLEKSSKAQMLKNIVEEAIQDDRKIIVFSFFKRTIECVRRLFAGHCTDPIDGSISPTKRQDIIDRFGEDPNLHVLASQIQAGGTGLNIQAASVVVMCEPQIKPSIESQAIARAHRMGQGRTVLVYRLCCEDTIDQRMLELLEQKKEQFEVFADQSIAGTKSLELNDGDMASILEQEIDSIKKRRGIKPDGVEFQNTAEGREWYEDQLAEGQAYYDALNVANSDRVRTVSDAQRQRILRRDNFTCRLCGAKGPGAGGSAELHVDHIKPFSLGGPDDDNNLWTLCASCNLGKSNKYDDTELANKLAGSDGVV